MIEIDLRGIIAKAKIEIAYQHRAAKIYKEVLEPLGW